MDYDNDGIMDMISGSYDPGDIYLFRGLGEGKYAKRELLKDENDIPLVHHPKEMAKYLGRHTNNEKESSDNNEVINWRVASFGSWIAMTDWEADGDLDALIGTFAGNMVLRKNIGSREKPIFSGEAITVKVDGEPLKVHCHANPVVADWDGDGKWDLVVGCGDGSVVWYRNTGSKTTPSFQAGQELVTPKSENIFLVQDLAPDNEPKPAVRAQICVTDYNLDGKLDLILGDYSDINWTKELSEEEQNAFDKIKARQKQLSEQAIEIQEKMYPEDETTKPGKSEMKSLQKQANKTNEEYVELLEQIKEFYLESRSASFIWMYERK